MISESTFQTERKSIAYSDKFITHPFTSEPYPGSASIEDVLQLRDANRNFLYKLKIEQKERGISHIWHEKRDPITQSDLIEGEEEEVQELIYQIKISSIRYNDEIANRLNTLFKDSKEEDPYGTGIIAGSLRNFINFLTIYPDVKCPSISLTPEHNIYVSWRENNRVFSIHFMPDKDVRFVIFMPNYRHPEKKIRIAGTVTVDVMIKIVEPYRITEWLFNEG